MSKKWLWLTIGVAVLVAGCGGGEGTSGGNEPPAPIPGAGFIVGGGTSLLAKWEAFAVQTPTGPKVPVETYGLEYLAVFQRAHAYAEEGTCAHYWQDGDASEGPWHAVAQGEWVVSEPGKEPCTWKRSGSELWWAADLESLGFVYIYIREKLNPPSPPGLGAAALER